MGRSKKILIKAEIRDEKEYQRSSCGALLQICDRDSIGSFVFLCMMVVLCEFSREAKSFLSHLSVSKPWEEESRV
ncbi:hypothetical protein VNO78_22017 [Psophocarpus tetragonolobus]|uniref:Uncharacterized protein n=1 Tax=Psophocarpus tetragonolobus TaxID=3891 RepID=A0AAN9SCK5_PSOTE